MESREGGIFPGGNFPGAFFRTPSSYCQFFDYILTLLLRPVIIPWNYWKLPENAWVLTLFTIKILYKTLKIISKSWSLYCDLKKKHNWNPLYRQEEWLKQKSISINTVCWTTCCLLGFLWVRCSWKLLSCDKLFLSISQILKIPFFKSEQINIKSCDPEHYLAMCRDVAMLSMRSRKHKRREVNMSSLLLYMFQIMTTKFRNISPKNRLNRAMGSTALIPLKVFGTNSNSVPFVYSKSFLIQHSR